MQQRPNGNNLRLGQRTGTKNILLDVGVLQVTTLLVQVNCNPSGGLRYIWGLSDAVVSAAAVPFHPELHRTFTAQRGFGALARWFVRCII